MTTDDGMTTTEDVASLRRWLREREGENRRQAAEIERLSLALANAKISFDAIDATLAERDAEIERLRHEVKLREQICADATLYARRLQEADAEIERLRGLLRKCQDVLNQVAETTLAADVMYEDINKAIGRDATDDT